MGGQSGWKWIRVLAAAAGLALLAAVVAYVLFPRYLPDLATDALPDYIKIERLELSRPGWSSTRVAHATLRVQGERGDTLLLADNAAFYYRVLDLSLHRVRVARLEIVLPRRQTDEPWRELPELTLPELAGLVFEVEKTALRWQDDSTPFLRLTRSHIEFDTGGLAAVTALNRPDRPPLALNTRWQLQMGRPAQMTVRLTSAAREPASIELQVSGIENDPALARADWQLSLSAPDFSGLIQAVREPWPGFGAAGLTIQSAGTIRLTPAELTLEVPGQSELRFESGPQTMRQWLSQPAFAGLDVDIRALAGSLLGFDVLGLQTSKPAMLRIALQPDGQPDVSWSAGLTASLRGAGLDLNLQLGEFAAESPGGQPWLNRVRAKGGLDLRLQPEGTVSLGQPAHTQIRRPVLTVKGRLEYADGSARLELQPGSQLGFESLRYRSAVETGQDSVWMVSHSKATLGGTLSLGRVGDPGAGFAGPLKLRGKTPGKTELQVGKKPAFAVDDLDFDLTGTWRPAERWPALTGRIEAKHADISAGQLLAGTITADIRDGRLVPLDIKAQVSAAQLRIISGDWDLPLDRAQGAARLRESGIGFEGSFWPRDGSRPQPLTVAYGTESKQASIELPALDLDLADVRPLLRQTLGKEFSGLKFNQGRIVGNLSLQAQGESLTGQGRLEVTNLKISMAEMVLADGRMEIAVDALSPLTLRQVIDTPSIRLGSDLQLEAVHARVNTRGTQVDLHDLRASLLQGDAALPEARLQGGQFGPGMLELDAIEIADLFGWIGIEDLRGSGRLNAHIPIRSSAGKLSIHEGTFRSDSGGTIRYSAGSGNPLGANLAMRALEDFRYKELDGTLDYAEDGEYRIKLHILGANPAVYNGFPIALNLDLTGRLPGVLQAALLTGDFTGSIIHQLQTGELTREPKE